MQNLMEILSGMEYPGRGILAGRNGSGDNVFAYFLTGRSAPSKAREFIYDDKTGAVSTNCTDPEQLKKGSPALLIYPAMIHSEKGVVVSNGSHTNLLNSALHSKVIPSVGSDDFTLSGDIMSKAMSGEPSLIYDSVGRRFIDQKSYEPDAPNNTPRIGLIALKNGACFGAVTKNPLDRTEFRSWSLFYNSGQGHLLTTYSGENKNPLPAFTGAPVSGSIEGWKNAAQSAYDVYNALNKNFRVSVVALHTNSKTGEVIDRHIINPARDADRL